MTTALLDGKGKNKEELEAMEMAEESRESEWTNPSFVAELFMGRLRTDMLLPYPEQSDDDRAIGDEYLKKVKKFLIENINADEIDRTGDFPDSAMKGLAELGAFGMKIPKEYGGLGLSQVNYNRVLAVIGGHCATTAALLSAHQSIGVPQPLMLFGTPEQKKKYLPRLARGAVSAFALTEPDVGSDPARMSTTATPTEDGKHYILNGIKLWCTNGAIADILVVMAQTPSIQKNGREKKQITAFIVEKGMPGFEVLHRCRFMGLNGVQNALLKFDQVKVPKENIILGLGKGLRLALITLNAGRLSLPAGCIGGVRLCLQIVRDWSNERKQWGALIGRHEASSDKIGFMTSHLFAMESITWLSGVWVDRKSHDIRLEAAMAKIFCSEHTDTIADQAMQLRGGRGYETAASLLARGEKPFPIERMVRDSRINRIVEGTSEILRLFIAREALDRHLKIAGDLLNSKLSFSKRFKTFLQATAFYSVWYPYQWLAPLFLRMNPFRYESLGRLGIHMRYASRASHQLARTIFHLMLLNGPKLEKKQLQLMRVVEIATDLFTMAAVVARASAMKKRQAQNKESIDAMAHLFCVEATSRIKGHFRAIMCNSDKLKHTVTQHVLDGQSEWIEKEKVFYS